MMSLIECNDCGKTGTFKIEIKVTPEQHSCEKCHKISVTSWTLFFCDMTCFSNWMNKNDIFKNGFPCIRCSATGFSYGFETNGKCELCNGNKYVKLEGSNNSPNEPINLSITTHGSSIK